MGPRTKFQLWCPNLTPPRWPPTYVKLVGGLSLEGEFPSYHAVTTEFVEVIEIPGDLIFRWEGIGTVDDEPLLWEAEFQRMGRGEHLDIKVSALGGTYWEFGYERNFNAEWMPGSLIQAGAADIVTTSPIVGASFLGLNMQAWH